MKTDDILFRFFISEFPFNVEGLEEFIASFQSVSYKKGEYLLRNDSMENELRFLDKGNVREFYFTEDKEINIGFYTRPEFITDFTSLTNSCSTKKNQECLTEVVVRVLPKNKFEIFLEKYSCGKVFIQNLFQRIITTKEQEYYQRLTLSPDELYQNLLSHHSEWLQKIPQYHLASYLGITPETLSRIRKRIS